MVRNTMFNSKLQETGLAALAQNFSSPPMKTKAKPYAGTLQLYEITYKRVAWYDVHKKYYRRSEMNKEPHKKEL